VRSSETREECKAQRAAPGIMTLIFCGITPNVRNCFIRIMTLLMEIIRRKEYCGINMLNKGAKNIARRGMIEALSSED